MLHNPNRDYIEIGGDVGERIKRTARDIHRLEIIDALELLRKPAPSRLWCVEPWIPHREVTLISGDGGIGKSTIALQLCAASAASLLWFGLEVRPGPALYVSCEDDIDEVHCRLEQIKSHQPDADLNRLHIVALAGKDAVLAKPSNGQMKPTALFEDIEKAVEQYKISLLVLDSAADVFGGNEIDRGHTRSFIQLLRGLAMRRNCAVVLLSHPSVDAMKTGRGYSGSTGAGLPQSASPRVIARQNADLRHGDLKRMNETIGGNFLSSTRDRVRAASWSFCGYRQCLSLPAP